MKKLITLALILLSMTANPFNIIGGEAPTPETTSIVSETPSEGTYRVTAYTQNTWGQNYWVDLTVKGSYSSWGSSIYSVYYGGCQISYYSDWNRQSVYYVVLSGRYYYFTF